MLLHYGKNSVIIHFNCHLGSFRLFGVAELGRGFLYLKNVVADLIPNVFVISLYRFILAE